MSVIFIIVIDAFLGPWARLYSPGAKRETILLIVKPWVTRRIFSAPSNLLIKSKLNAETEEVNVVYKRKGHRNYDLAVPSVHRLLRDP